MNKIKFLLLIGLITLLPHTIYGLSASISCTKTTLEVDETTICSVTASDEEDVTTFTGTVTGNSNIEVIGGSLSFNIGESQSFQVKALSEGAGLLTLSGDFESSLPITITSKQSDNTGDNEGNNQNEQPQDNSNNNQNQNKSSDSSLKSISLSSGSLNFSSSTYNYDVQVESNISNLKVTAQSNDSLASIKYSPSDSVSLKYGETKTISIIVLAEDGSSSTYKINVTRKNLDVNTTPSSSNVDLKSLTVEGVTFTFEPDKVSYSLTVPNEVEEALINYELNDSTSTATIDGDTKLKEGRNKIKIIVKSSSGNTKTYTLNITRSKTRISVINDESEIVEKLNSNDKSDLYVNINIEEEKIISKNILEALSKTEKDLSYEVLNNERELLYSITLNGKNIKNTDDFNYQLSFISNTDDKLSNLIKSNNYVSLLFKNNSSIPGKMQLKVFVGDRIIKDYKKIDLYRYNGNKLKLVKKDIEINDGYVDIEIDENTEYVLTKLEKEEKTTTSYIIPVIIMLILVVIIVISLLLRNKKEKKVKKDKNSQEQ